MTTTTTSSTGTMEETGTDINIDIEAVQAFAGKVAGDLGLGHNSLQVYLGDRLGLWRALAGVRSATSQVLADRTGLAERYVREWLSAQAASGYVTYDPATRGFALPPAHALVLADDDSPAAMAGGFEVLAAVWASVDQLAHAYTTGEGIGWHEHDSRLFRGFERFFRSLYRNSLTTEWLPGVKGLLERLEEGIEVLDVGCGTGAAVLMMAEAFPRSSFVGVDCHEESVHRANTAAAAAGVADRVVFVVQEASEYVGTYDLICFFDSLHDMGDPEGVLRHARQALAPGGVVMAVEPQAGDRLEDNLHPLGLTWYASSAALCVPNSVSQGGTGLGSQAGPTRTLQVFTDAGYSRAERVADTLFNFVVAARA
jgi:2-polyprenyl-3-methyl-5-hydroxy-6-metoxy-1,4-benzoquinol methylase